MQAHILQTTAGPGRPFSTNPTLRISRSLRPHLFTRQTSQRPLVREVAQSVAPRAAQRMEDELLTAKAKDNSKKLTLPTILTLLRVASIPVLVGVWFSQWSLAPAVCCGVFVAACLTDYLDGYLARKMGTSTPFGAFLDPVADKLMVATVLILLATEPIKAGIWAGNTWLLPVLSSAIIGREITMSALREWAASCSQEAHQAVAVSSWGKWKTATQMTSMSLLLATSGGVGNRTLEVMALLGAPMLCFATFLTLWSLADYMRGVWPYM